jgi:metal-dependent hydrolase (beta-lactamase superfamily II)
MHLGSSSIHNIEEIADFIDTCNFDKIIPLHCTGDMANEYFKTRFGDKCFNLLAGDVIEI